MSLQILALTAGLLAGSLGACHAGTVLPSRFEAGRVYVTPRAASGSRLTLYTDSGGGGPLLSRAAAERLHLPLRPATDPDMKAELGADAMLAPFPHFAKDDPTPPPPERQTAVVRRVAQVPGWPEQGDGLLGQSWFGGHVWTWDYPARKFILEHANFAAPKSARAVPLGFKTDAHGKRVTNFPRIVVKIDGADVPLLLDTGAETFLTPVALAALKDGEPRLRATSMIAKSLFDALRKKHPGWRVIPDAQVGTHAAMIEAPDVEIAGLHSGPVWFTERPDANFHKFMSGMMSGRVEGSIGGNALGRFRMTVDYPHAKAWFACSDCAEK